MSNFPYFMSSTDLNDDPWHWKEFVPHTHRSFPLMPSVPEIIQPENPKQVDDDGFFQFVNMTHYKSSKICDGEEDDHGVLEGPEGTEEQENGHSELHRRFRYTEGYSPHREILKYSSEALTEKAPESKSTDMDRTALKIQKRKAKKNKQESNKPSSPKVLIIKSFFCSFK
jgi:hypothetical protein